MTSSSSIYAPKEFQYDPAGVKRVGVVKDGVFYTVEHRDPRRGGPLAILAVEECSVRQNQAGVYALFAATYNCPVVWVLERDRAVMELDTAAFPAEAFTWHNLSDDDVICGYVAQRLGEDGKGHGVPYNIFYPGIRDAWSVGWALDDDESVTPQTFASGVALAAFTLDQQLRFSPGAVGNYLLRRRLAKWEAWQVEHAKKTGEPAKAVLQLSDEWRNRFLYEIRATPVQQVIRPIPTPADTGEDTVTIHLYDRNWSYVSSAREIPNGDPLPTPEFMPGCPGVYLVQYIGGIVGRKHTGMWIWEWEPQLREAMRLGAVFYIQEGYYWPKDRVIDLRVWNDDMWAALAAARAWDSLIGQIAEAIIKDCGRAAIGKLAQHTGRGVVSEEQALRDGLRILSYETNDQGRDTGNVEVEMALGRSDLIMPHWWSYTISNANERLQYAIATYAADDALLGYVDQFYCTVLHPELDGDPMKRGGWKYSGSFRIPVGDLDRLNGMDAQALVKAFAKYQREQR